MANDYIKKVSQGSIRNQPFLRTASCRGLCHGAALVTGEDTLALCCFLKITFEFTVCVAGGLLSFVYLDKDLGFRT